MPETLYFNLVFSGLRPAGEEYSCYHLIEGIKNVTGRPVSISILVRQRPEPYMVEKFRGLGSNAYTFEAPNNENRTECVPMYAPIS